MSEPDFTNPEEIKKQFYHYQKEADFDRMGPWLNHILTFKGEVDIPEEHLRQAFEAVIIYRLNDGKTEEALQYMARIGSAGEIQLRHRKMMIETLFDYINQEEEQLVKADWADLKNFLKRQIKYLQLHQADGQLVNKMISLHEEIDHKMMGSSDEEEGPLRAFITGFTNQFYKYLPPEEAADYASQIVLESSKRYIRS